VSRAAKQLTGVRLAERRATGRRAPRRRAPVAARRSGGPVERAGGRVVLEVREGDVQGWREQLAGLRWLARVLGAAQSRVWSREAVGGSWVGCCTTRPGHDHAPRTLAAAGTRLESDRAPVRSRSRAGGCWGSRRGRGMIQRPLDRSAGGGSCERIARGSPSGRGCSPASRRGGDGLRSGGVGSPRGGTLAIFGRRERIAHVVDVARGRDDGV
jgi:hypothetical protein